MIVVVDFGAGNVGSVANMLRKIGAPVVVSDDPDVIGDAERLVVPGVGAFDVAMASIEERGLVCVLDDRASSGVPILGICLGMQLFARSSEEGERPGLGWIAGDVRRLRPAVEGDRLVVPHMGWDRVRVTRLRSRSSRSPSATDGSTSSTRMACSAMTPRTPSG